MKFKIDKNKYNTHSMMKRLGYSPHPKNKSFVRRLSADRFPRFHIYIQDLDTQYEFSFHLDQKGACYAGHTAHSGDYDSGVLDAEKDRIIKTLG